MSFTVHTLDLDFQGHPEAIAAFLVEGPEGLVLIETGPESTRPVLLEGMKKLGFAETDLSAVFVTHVHLDHAGAAGWFANRGIPVHVHHKGVKHLVDPARLIESARMVYGDRFDSLWGEMAPAPEDRVISLEDGRETPVAGLVIEAIDTPGHAFHHHAFAIGKVLFAGDAAGARLPGSEYTAVTSAPPQFHLECWLESLSKLQAAGFTRCFLTHFGEIESDPAEHLGEYRARLENAVRFVRERLAEGMDGDSLQVAYGAYQMEQAFQAGLPGERWHTFEAMNSAAMCADGLRLYLEKQEGDS